VLGSEHLHTATSLGNLARLLHDLGDLAGARPYYERALASRMSDLPPEEWTPGEGAGMLPGWKCPWPSPDGSTVRSSSVKRSG
jgi:hypothetical protein